MTEAPVLQIELAGIPKLRSGKVREVFDLGDSLLFVATDRISAFDCILPTGIPRKGEILTQMSHFWFRELEGIVRNHCLSRPGDPFPPRLAGLGGDLERRGMIVRKAQPLPIECVARGYLAGSGWSEYEKTGAVCGNPLPPGLLESSELPEPIFTPATKAVSGHDENISFERASGIVGRETAERVRDLTLRLYRHAREHARRRGIIIADTKFEFGWHEGELLLIDEALTPDSSRFWPADAYEPGRPQPSFDKQYVRDYLLGLDWDRRPPAPPLPEDVVRQTQAKYLEAYERLTGRPLNS
jgi:phosphoribosylaminoimidazole-succinocarboxamide synthase